MIGWPVPHQTSESFSYLAYRRFWQVPFSMAGGEYVSVSTQKRHGRSCCEPRTSLVGSRSKVSKRISLPRLSSKWRMRNFRKILTERAFLKHPLKALVEEKYGIEYEEFTNPWHAAASSFLAFSVGSLPPSSLLFSFQLTIAFR